MDDENRGRVCPWCQGPVIAEMIYATGFRPFWLVICDNCAWEQRFESEEEMRTARLDAFPARYG